MATDATKWVIIGSNARTNLAPGGGGYVAQLKLLTQGDTGQIAARIEEIGAADAKRRLLERVTGHESVERYRLVRTEADAIAQQIHGLQATASRLYAERQELLAHAAPGFSVKVVVIDKKAAEVEAQAAEAKQGQEAIRTTVAKAKQDAVAAVEIASADVRARLTWEMGVLVGLTIDQIARELGPRLTELVAAEQAHLVALGGPLIGDVGTLVEELAAPSATATEEAAR